MSTFLMISKADTWLQFFEFTNLNNESLQSNFILLSYIINAFEILKILRGYPFYF